MFRNVSQTDVLALLSEQPPSYMLEFSQPNAMRSETYLYGVHPTNGHLAWQLFCASRVGDYSRVEKLLDADASLVNAQYWYEFPIHMAVRSDHLDIAKLLIERGADPGQSRYTYNSWDKLLRITQERGFSEMEAYLSSVMLERFNYDPRFVSCVELIKKRNFNDICNFIIKEPELMDSADAFGNSVLHWAVLSRNLELINFLLNKNIDPDVRRADGQTPILLGINGDYWYRDRDIKGNDIADRWDVIRLLIELGANYVLSVACAIGDEVRVDEILRSNPSEGTRLDTGRRSPLAYAAGNGHTQIVKKLLDLGADPNAPEECSTRGRALFESCAGNHLETSRLLLEYGADPNAGVDSSGSCLTIVEFKHPNSAKKMQNLLRSHGATKPSFAMTDQELGDVIKIGDISIQDDQFLHELIGRDNLELINLFVKRFENIGELLQLTDIWGGNYPKNRAIISVLIEKGLNINKPNWVGRTFLHKCAEEDDVNTADILLEFGANIDAIEAVYGETPIASAARCGKVKMVTFLKEKGADLSGDSKNSWSQPILIAESKGYSEVIAALT